MVLVVETLTPRLLVVDGLPVGVLLAVPVGRVRHLPVNCAALAVLPIEVVATEEARQHLEDIKKASATIVPYRPVGWVDGWVDMDGWMDGWIRPVLRVFCFGGRVWRTRSGPR